jgi:hypothetical protein
MQRAKPDATRGTASVYSLSLPKRRAAPLLSGEQWFDRRDRIRRWFVVSALAVGRSRFRLRRWRQRWPALHTDATVVNTASRFVAQGGAWTPSDDFVRAIDEVSMGRAPCRRL